MPLETIETTFMSEHENKSEEASAEEAPSSSMMSKLIVWGVVFVMGVGTGAAVSLFVLPTNGETAQAASDGDSERMDIPEPDDKKGFIDFGEVRCAKSCQVRWTYNGCMQGYLQRVRRVAIQHGL